MTPVGILSILRKHPDANITFFQRNALSAGQVGGRLSGGATVGCTINYTNPAYKGWGRIMEEESIFIQIVHVQQIQHLLIAEKWSIPHLKADGTIYRLKPEYFAHDRSEFFTTGLQLDQWLDECRQIIASKLAA